MTNKLLQDVGETYEYIRKIIENKIEIAKIDSAQKAASMMGNILLITSIAVSATFIFMILALVGAYLLFVATESLLIAVVGVCLIISFPAIIILFFRRILIYRPVSKFIYSHILND